MITRRDLARVHEGDDTIVRLREVTAGTAGGGETLTDLAADTLRPGRRIIRQPNASVEIEYGSRHVTGVIRVGQREFPVNVELEAPAFGEAAALETAVLALPLTEGYSVTLRSVETGLLQRVRRWSLTVAAREIVEVPAGRFSAFRVELVPLDDVQDGKTLWVSQRTPRLLVQTRNRLPPEFGGTVTTTRLVTSR